MKVSNNKMKPEEEEEGSAHQDISEKNECSPEKAKGRRTGPCIPPIRQKVLKSTEEQELEKRMKMQQEVIEMRKKNEEFKKFALAGAGLPVKKSVTQVTKSVDFHFRTDERIKQHPKNQEEYKEVNFTSELRKHPPLLLECQRDAPLLCLSTCPKERKEHLMRQLLHMFPLHSRSKPFISEPLTDTT